MCNLYILYNENIDRYYIGCTNDLGRRLEEHNSKTRKNRYTEKQKGLWVVKYIEEFANQKEARRRESYIKKQKSRFFIENLIASKAKCAGSSMDRATAF